MSKRTDSEVRSVPTGWADTLTICRKCSKKLGGGFGKSGKEELRHAVREALKAAGRRGSIGILQAGCFKLCPKDAVTVAIGSRPGELVVVPKGMVPEVVGNAVKWMQR
jgi:predicted metal-binding protein